MKPTDGTSLQTRPSLLHLLSSGDDAQSWQEFYRIYGGLIRHFATKARSRHRVGSHHFLKVRFEFAQVRKTNAGWLWPIADAQLRDCTRQDAH